MGSGALLLVALILVTACGYHFPGSGALPAGIRSVYLDADPADSPLAQAVADALRRDGEVRLVSSRSQADGVLVVEGGGISSSAAAIDTSGVATEYEVKVSADFQLLKPGREAGEVVSEAQSLETSATFPSEGTSPTAEEANKRRAGRQAAEDLAGRILRSVKSGF